MNKIIGQEKLLKTLKEQIDTGKFPRFITIVGDRGGGKKLIAKWIAEELGAKLVKPENDEITVDYIREVIDTAYNQTSPIVYLLPEIETHKVSKQAKNSLLKVTEEPPNNAYFITTVIDRYSIMPTLLSRTTIYTIGKYTPQKLREFAAEKGYILEDRLYNIISTPGDVINMAQSNEGKEEFNSFVESVVDNIGEVSGANALKISSKISFSTEDEGYRLETFWILFKQKCLEKSNDIKNSKRNMYFSFIRITTTYISKLSIMGINKKMLFDMWILEIRDTYFKYN